MRGILIGENRGPMIKAHNLSQQEMLHLGRYEDAFSLYDHERSINDEKFRAYGMQRWHGESLVGKRILVTHEWGLGDCLMALRFLQLLQHADSVAVSVPDCLMRVAEIPDVYVYGNVVPIEFDVYCPIMRLIRYFHNSIPRPPYLFPFHGLSAKMYAKHIVPMKRRIGIAWRGNPKHLRDKTRSIDLETFLELLPKKDGQFYSLQNLDQEAALERGIVAPVYDDFAQVAAMAALMQEIIVVDTACTNLIGAMGLKASVLLDANFDWRWHRAADWYPSLQCCVQDTQGDWESAFRKLT